MTSTPAELTKVRYIEYDYWDELSGGTRLAVDAAARIRAGVTPFGVPNGLVLAIAQEQVTGRLEVIAQIAALLDGQNPGHPLRVAIDGVTSSGKTTLAGELAEALTGRGRPVIRLSMDGYHHPREYRYRKGRTSPDGYYEDAYDFDAFARLVLMPLGPGGDRRYHRRVIDLASDTPVSNDIAIAAPDAVVLVDGSFLQRPEIIELWDCRIYADTSLAVARQRGVARDAA